MSRKVMFIYFLVFDYPSNHVLSNKRFLLIYIFYLWYYRLSQMYWNASGFWIGTASFIDSCSRFYEYFTYWGLLDKLDYFFRKYFLVEELYRTILKRLRNVEHKSTLCQPAEVRLASIIFFSFVMLLIQ